jgi:hypothetical protein
MTDGPEGSVPLEPHEQRLRAWRVEPARPDGSADRAGWLVLTSHRIRFFQNGGIFGTGPVQLPPRFTWRLEEIRTVAPRRYEMNVGYGDRLAIPGVAIDGQGFRLNRETSAPAVFAEIERVRRARRSELHFPLL